MPFSKNDFKLSICIRHEQAHNGRCGECTLHHKVLKLKKLERVALKEFEELERLEAEAAANALIKFSRELEVEKRFPIIVSLIRRPSIMTRKESKIDRIWLRPSEWASENKKRILNGSE